jgi:hypothetical protein
VALRKYRKWPFSAARRIKSLEPISTEIGVIDYVIEVWSTSVQWTRLPIWVKLSTTVIFF